MHKPNPLLGDRIGMLPGLAVSGKHWLGTFADHGGTLRGPEHTANATGERFTPGSRRRRGPNDTRTAAARLFLRPQST